MEEKRGVAVAIGYASGKEEPQITFTGSADEVAASLVLAFGLSEGEARAPLGELIPVAAQKARALWLLVDQLDARPVPLAEGAPAPAPTPTAQPAAPSPAPAQQQLGGLNPLYKAIADTPDVEGLRRLYGQHQSQFDSDPALLDAWKQRGRFLQAQHANA
jgi:hypothetical protein